MRVLFQVFVQSPASGMGVNNIEYLLQPVLLR
jgi:hypothetical protein